LAFGFSLLLLLSQPSTLHSQPAAPTNRVLHLDGTNSYVQLPPNIFDSLTQATVEGWVKWNSMRSNDRFFDFGERNREMYVRADGLQLTFLITTPDGTRQRIEAAGILRSNEWGHVAAVSGPAGAKLYFNGDLVGSNAYTGSFSGLKGLRNYLGKSNFRATDPTTRAQMDELRVWDHERRPEQIRENLFKTLAGTEPGLVGYWNFDDGTVKDRSAGKHDGTVLGNAQFVEAALPEAGSLRNVQVAWVSGKVTRPDGGAVTNLDIIVREGTRRIASLRTDQAGEYRVTVVPGAEAIQFTAVRGDLGGGQADLNLVPGEVRRIDLLGALGDGHAQSLPLRQGHRSTASRRPSRRQGRSGSAGATGPGVAGPAGGAAPSDGQARRAAASMASPSAAARSGPGSQLRST